MDRRLIVSVFALAAAGACAGADDAAQSADAKPRAEATRHRSACDLITAEEATAILGSPVTPKDGARGADESACTYTTTDTQQFTVTAYWRGGKEQWQINQTGRALAGRLMASEGKEEVDKVMKTEAADALGDASSFSPILGSLVLKGDALLEFRLLVKSQEREKWEALARQALSRLQD